MEGRFHVSDSMQLLVDGTFFVPLLVGFRIDPSSFGISRLDGFKYGFRRQHGTLHGGVSAFDFGYVHEPSTATDETTSRKGEFRYALEPTFVQCPGSVAKIQG